jgi:hypothetical protein
MKCPATIYALVSIIPGRNSWAGKPRSTDVIELSRSACSVPGERWNSTDLRDPAGQGPPGSGSLSAGRPKKKATPDAA